MSGVILDAAGGVVTRLHEQPGEAGVVMSVSQEVGEVMERCARLRAAEPTRGLRKTGTFRQVAELPAALAEILKARGLDVMADPEALRRVLNDPAFAAFRTSSGRV